MKRTNRKKTNFMIDIQILEQIKEWIPEGTRSDFVNEALEKGIERFRNIKAFEGIEKLRDEINFNMTTEEIIKLKNYGRK